METIRELLSRIRWDPEFGKGQFSLAYYDRVEDELITVAFGSVVLAAHEHFALTVIDAAGVAHSVPFHRVRRVWKDGELIWSRESR